MNLGDRSVPTDDALLNREQDELAVPPLAVLWLSPEDEHGLRRSAESQAGATPAQSSSNLRAGTSKEPPTAKMMSRLVPKQAWGRGERAGALLVTSTGFGVRQETMLIGVGHIAALRVANNSNERRLAITDAELLPRAIRWDDIVSRLATDRRRQLSALLNEVVRPLPHVLAQSLLAALDSTDRVYIRERLRRKLLQQEDSADAADRDREDRFATSIKIFGLNYGRSTPQPDMIAESGLPDLIKRTRPLWETKIIRTDSRHLLPDWERTDEADAWFRFTKGSRRLYLLEAHADVEEAKLGGDLIYVRQNPDAMVLVQYKRAIMGAKTTEARCPVDARFTDQLRRMSQMDREETTSLPEAGVDYRLSVDCGYIKLIEDRPRLREPGNVYQGYYFPVEYINRLLREVDTSISIDLEKDRYLDSQTFIRLASDGWIGTVGIDTQKLLDKIDASGLLRPDEDVTIAMDIPV